jgi:elongation factor G
MADDVKLVRSIGIAGQGGAGKTSVADALIYAAGAVTRLGHVDEDTSNFDLEDEEIRRKTTLTTGFHSATWQKHDFTFLDFPGYANFLPDALNCMRACTGVVMVLAPAADEIRVEAEKMWARAAELNLPCVAFVSRMDRENASFSAATDGFQKILGARPVPIHYAIGSGDEFRGVVDLVQMRAFIAGTDGDMKEEAVPADLKDEVEAAREQMMETAAEATDELTEKYLENGTLTTEEIVQALRLGTLARVFVPVLCGSGTRGISTRLLLDACIDYLPGAQELGNLQGEDPKVKEPIDRRPEADEAFSGLVVKTIVDPFAGKLSIFRVLSGTVKSDSNVLNVTRDTKERLGHLLKLNGKKQAQVDHAVPGEIVAVAKLKETTSGDTLADDKAPILYPGLLSSPPAISFAIEPKSRGDEDKANQALTRMLEEDPSLDMHRDPQTRELILSGVGQLHIEVVIERLHRKYNVDVELKAPKVPYKETIKGHAKAQGKLKKQTGGRGQYGDAWLEVESLPRGTGFEFVDKIVGGVVPRQYIPAVEKGVREAMVEGFLAGYPMVDLRVTLYDGSFHDVDSSEMAFKIAASMGFKTAVSQAKPILLEPVMSMEVAVPDDCMGDVIGDLNSRRGKVLGVDSKPNSQVIRAQVPMSEVLKYAPDLRSMTSGRGSFTVGFSHYEELPAHLTEKVIKQVEAAKAEKE